MSLGIVIFQFSTLMYMGSMFVWNLWLSQRIAELERRKP